MGTEFGLTASFLNDFIISIKKITRDKILLNSEDIKDIISNLVKFFMSDEYLFLKIGLEKDESEKDNDLYMTGIIFNILEYFEKYLSIKCLFPLLEELKKSKFENRINRFNLLLKNKNEIEGLGKNITEKHRIFMEKFGTGEDWQRNVDIISCVENDKYIKLFHGIFDYLIESEILGKHKINKKKLIEGFFGGFKNGISSIKKFGEKRELKQLLNDLLSLNYSLKFTNELYQLFIAGFNLIILAFDDDFETEDKTKIYHIHFYLYPVYLGIKNNFKDKKSINIKDIVNNLKEFFMSDKFISLGLTMKDIIDINSLFSSLYL